MFRKPLPTTGAHKLGGSDEKKLCKQIVAAFPCATEEDAMELVPKKSELSLQKLAAPSRTQIYVGDGQPVFYDASGKGDLFPTVFALWRAPGILGEPVSVLGAPALQAALLVPLMFSTARALGLSTPASLVVACGVLLDGCFLVESRLVLTDATLLLCLVLQIWGCAAAAAALPYAGGLCGARRRTFSWTATLKVL